MFISEDKSLIGLSGVDKFELDLEGRSFFLSLLDELERSAILLMSF
jgi:hypothetical protein